MKMIIFLILGVLILSLLVCLIKVLARKNSQKKEIRQAASDRIRDENLNQVILNQSNEQVKNQPKPYEVNYENGSSQSREKLKAAEMREKGQIMVQLVENTELSSRKFVLNPQKGICIGSALTGNDIVLAGDHVGEHQCEIFLAQNKVYIKSLSNVTRTIIKRKKEKAIVDERGIRLLTGDQVYIGKVYYEVSITD